MCEVHLPHNTNQNARQQQLVFTELNAKSAHKCTLVKRVDRSNSEIGEHKNNCKRDWNLKIAEALYIKSEQEFE